MLRVAEILSQKIKIHEAVIDEWFANKFKTFAPNFYNSIDIRHSDFKICPVDVNCFPAGFNNLSEESKNLAIKATQNFFANQYSQVQKILIIPENHTRNLAYLENVLVLQEIIKNSGKTVVIGSLINELKEPTKISLEKNDLFLELEPIKNNDSKISTISGFVPDLIISNNDFTDGVPQILQNISQPIIPSTKLGWYQRLKSNYFDIYCQLISEICDLIDFDPWLLCAAHDFHENIDFKEKNGVEELAKKVDKMLQNTAKKYQQYNIDEKPFCYIKSDNGTYGMAVMTVDSADEILHINKKDRNKMNMLKGNVKNQRVIIQEGIKTTDFINDKIAEPMIYMINGEVISNLFRINESRTQLNSLNASGMVFAELASLNESELKIGNSKNNMINIYSFIAKICAIASTQETLIYK